MKNDLVNYSNKRSNKNYFKTYDDYIYYQTKVGLSFEKDSLKWTKGQLFCIEKKFFNIPRDLKILDICCGDGTGLQKFKELGFTNVTGIEISDEKINHAKKIGYEVIKKDICCEEFNFDTQFDIIYSSHTIEHVLNPEYTLKNIQKILKDEGMFFLVLPYPDVEASNPENDIRFKVHCGVVPLGLHIKDNGKSLCYIINNLGFKINHINFHEYREPEVHLVLTKK